MRAFWDDGSSRVASDMAKEVDLREAGLLWSDGNGVKGNFLGLIDDQERTVQFYFDDSIPDNVEDARHLKIVLLDFPVAERRGSYARSVAIGEVQALIEAAFKVGADYRQFGELTFVPW